MIRQPMVAGQFYPSDFHNTNQQIQECFNHKFGPGAEPSKRKGNICGVISPHAGYTFSGPCAAWSMKAIGESEFPDAYLIIGLNHSGSESAFSEADWSTPFGIVKNHSTLTKALSEASGIPINEDTHRTEHSIEVQLPMLQFVSKDRLPQLRIVPLMIGREHDFRTISENIKNTLKDLNKKIVIIASSDFTHYGPAYRYVPFGGMVKTKMYDMDKKAIRFISELDSKGFLDYIEDTGATICGKYPISLMIELLRNDVKDTLLEIYYTSGDITGDYTNSVGYASIILK